MRVIFTPDGGFGGTGGFIEVKNGAKITGKEEVYQKQGFLNLRLICRDIGISHGISVIDEKFLANEAERTRTSTRRISGTGTIQNARWQRHRLSFFGRDETYSEIEVTIRERPEVEAAYVAGLSVEADMDLDGEEMFFAEITITAKRMDMLMHEIQQPNAELYVSIHLSAFQNFYATWSPAIDEGRVIKFLNSDRDIENRDEVPNEFWNKATHQEMLTDANVPPISVEVIRRFPSTMAEQETEAPQAAAIPGHKSRTKTATLSYSESITAASKRISRRISILCIVVLVAAVLVAG